jgi:cytochrome c-type biogenesis protein CcmH/NrfF
MVFSNYIPVVTMNEKFQELTEVLDRLKRVNEEIDRMQTRVIEDLKRKVDELETRQRSDELVLEKVVYRMKLTRSHNS